MHAYKGKADFSSLSETVHHYIFRRHPDINTAPMTFNHQLSIGWQVCTPPHFNLQYTQQSL